MINALDYSIKEWEDILANLGEPKYRAKQVMQGIVRGDKIADISNLSQSLKQKLSDYSSNTVTIYKTLISERDGTRKYIFNLGDGNIIEGVLMSYKYGNTVCISTQVGCRMNCAFCASGLDGLIRNLTAGEILGQVIAVNRDISEKGERNISNIVLMGSGEPMDNYDNVLKFLKLVSSPDGMCVSLRNVSLSTSGLVDKIRALADTGLTPTLTISLHAPTDEIRETIMPINRKYPLRELIDSARYYFEKTGRRIIFEYSAISGVNDSLDCAEKLSKLVRGMPCHVNIINLNKVKENTLKGSTSQAVASFIAVLERNNISVSLRRTMGSDIEGACGQLRRKILSENCNE